MSSLIVTKDISNDVQYGVSDNRAIFLKAKIVDDVLKEVTLRSMLGGGEIKLDPRNALGLLRQLPGMVDDFIKTVEHELAATVPHEAGELNPQDQSTDDAA